MNENLEQKKRVVLLLEVLDYVRRWWWTLAAGALVGLAGGLVALDNLPKQYKSITLILVGPSQIPEQWVQIPQATSMALRLRSLRDSVLSRDYLARLVEEVYKQPAGGIEGERLMAGIRPRVNVRVVPVDRSRGSGYFEISFTDEDPQLAANVVNALAEFFIAANVDARIADARKNEALQKRLMDESWDELRQRKEEVSRFKERYPGLLPEYRDQNQKMWEARRRDLEAVDRSIQEASGQIGLLSAEKRENERLRRELGGPAAGATRTMAERIGDAEKALEAALATKTESHPEVVRLRRNLEALRASAAGGPAEEGGPQKTPLDAQIEIEEQRLVSLREQKVRIQAELASMQSRIGSMPVVEREYQKLTDGLGTLEENHGERLKNYESAKAARIALEEQHGEQFEVIDRAVAPLLPVSPKPMVVLGASVGVGFLLFVAPLVIRRLFQPVVFSEAALEAMLDVPVLVKISEVETKAVIKRRRRRILANVGLTAASILVLVVAVATTFIPRLLAGP